MKRSHTIALAALGVVGAAVLLSGEETPRPEAPKDAALYANVDECVRANVLGRDTCEEQFRAAQEKHLAESPKFPEKSTCETQYGAGQCQQKQVNGASVFVPAMIGFMVGNYLSNARNAQALLPPRMGAAACPPGVTPAMQPGCTMPRQTTTSSSGTGSGWRSYSTVAGHSVSRTDTGNGVARVPDSVARSTSAPRPSTSGAPHSAPSVTRGGFGSTAHSSSSHSAGG